MHFKNWVQMTLADYPQKIAASLFTGGCNFRCPNCHNRELVLSPDLLPDVPTSEIEAFLGARRGLLDGVVISGGEPTLQPDLISFCAWVRQMGYAVKLDTNGYRPDVLRAVVSVVDYVAMDVKAPLAKYESATGVRIDTTRIERSVGLLLESELCCEFRTTVVPGLLDEQDIAEISAWLAAVAAARKSEEPAAVHFCLQQFVPRDTLDPAMLERVPYSPRRLHAMAELARQQLPHVELRGI